MNHPDHITLESMSQALWYNRWTLRKFAHALRGDILEVGCGIGNFTEALTSFGSVWAIDTDAHAVKQTKTLLGKRARVGNGDIERGTYFFRKSSFDTIVCMNVLEHIEDDTEALSNMHALLKPGGSLVLLVPIHSFLYSSIDHAIDHYRRYEPDQLLRTTKHHGFDVMYHRKLNFLGALGWFVRGKVMRRQTVSLGSIRMFNAIAPIVLPLEDIVEPVIGTSILLIAKK